MPREPSEAFGGISIMQTLRFVTVASAALLLFGCGDDRPPPSDSGSDTSIAVDTGTGDTGTGDTSPPTDTGTRPDSGSGTCGGDACNLVTGGGCGPGEGCHFLAPMEGADPTAICAGTGTAGDGADCMSYMDCQEGFSCVTPMGAMMGTCQHYCCPGGAGSDSVCPTGQTCTTTFAGTDVGFCSFPDDCDPVSMVGCSGAEACYPGPDGTFQCAMSGDLAEGDTCDMFVNECQAGLACLMGQCFRLCNSMTMMGCGPMQMCTIGLTGFDSLGACDPVATP